MARQAIFPDPNKESPGFSPATRVGTTIHVSGQVAMDANGALVGPGDCKAQAEQCFKNIETALKAAGATMDDLVKITCFLVNTSDYEAYAAVRRQRFPQNGPASSTVIIKALVKPEFLIEIEGVAVLAGSASAA